MNDDLARFAKRIPADGMYLEYLDKACELMNLYGEGLSIMEDERTFEAEKELKKLLGKSEKSLGVKNSQVKYNPTRRKG